MLQENWQKVLNLLLGSSFMLLRVASLLRNPRSKVHEVSLKEQIVFDCACSCPPSS